MAQTSFIVIWRQLIENSGVQVTNALDLSSLAKISDGYTQGHMVQVVRTILTERRLQQLAKRPLTAAEFITPLAKIDPVFQDEEEALKVKTQPCICLEITIQFYYGSCTLPLPTNTNKIQHSGTWQLLVAAVLRQFKNHLSVTHCTDSN